MNLRSELLLSDFHRHICAEAMIPTDHSELTMHSRDTKAGHLKERVDMFHLLQEVSQLSLARSLVVQTCGGWAP